MKYKAVKSLVIVLLLYSCKPKKEEIVSPIISPITESVFASGHIESRDQFILSAVNDGYIKEVKVSEGDQVAVGQVLVVQDNTAAAIQEQVAAESLSITERQASGSSPALLQLQAELSSAEQKRQADKVHLERMQQLYATGSVAKADLDNAQLIFATSANQVTAIQKNMESMKLSLKQTVVSSRGQFRTAAANSSYYDIKSPGNYKVFSLLKKKEEWVRKGEGIAILGSAADMKIILNVDENSILKIRDQQVVLVEVNTDRQRVYTAKVSRISPAFDPNTQSYRVEALFDTTSAHLLSGTLLQANVIIAQKDEAMLIPRNALRPNGKVWLKNGNRIDTQTIRVGIISNEWVEVLSGLHVRDKIIM